MAASAETRLVVFTGLCSVCSGGRHDPDDPLTFLGAGSQRERARGPPGGDRP